MRKKSYFFADILFLLMLSVSVISYIPSLVSFDRLISSTSNIVTCLGVLVLSFIVYFIVKNIDLSLKAQKIVSIVMLTFFFAFDLCSVFFFNNATGEWSEIYFKIKKYIPYLFVLVQFYSLDCIRSNKNRFSLLMYTSFTFLVFSFISLDISGAILVILADLIYSLFKIKGYFFKSIIFFATCALLYFVLLLSIGYQVDMLVNNSGFILKNKSLAKIKSYTSLLEVDSSVFDKSPANWIEAFKDSYPFIASISLAVLLFVIAVVMSVISGVCIPYWIFMCLCLLLTFVSILNSNLVFDFYIYSPSLITIFLNSIAFGVIYKRKLE